MSAQATEQQAAIELIVEQDPEGQVAANVPVRWRISNEMVQTLAEQAVADPYMLLVVTNGEREMDRHLVPLKAGMTYLQMRRPGTNVIHAAIVWRVMGEDSVKRIINAKDDYGNYKLDLVRRFVPGLAEVRQQIEELHERMDWGNADKQTKRELKALKLQRDVLQLMDDVYGLFDGFRAFGRSAEGDEIRVEVPEVMFAKEPPAWMNWLGTLYKWPRKAQDQCDLRRRALVTALSLPLAVPVVVVVAAFAAVAWLAFKLSAVMVTGVLLFFGKRGLDYSVIYEWDNFDLKDIWYRAKPSVWLYKKTEIERPSGWDSSYIVRETEYVRRNVAFAFINPPFMVLSFIISLGLNSMIGGSGSVSVNAVGAVLGAVVVGLVASLAVKWQQKRKASANDKKKVVNPEQKNKLERDLILLTSGGSARLSDLPTRQRSVRLRYLHLKAAVCKPFAK